ncbi:hypothetical protein, conserved [Leishmania tarentolae]|uniref:Uncharacterized protein n=1 Tax=Leishmania tarentolae TaxID=5689 RepID=A0A640KYE8_LEITA|nr:hypothetical protein, conserved [Leishmania tarentolae]
MATCPASFFNTSRCSAALPSSWRRCRWTRCCAACSRAH